MPQPPPRTPFSTVPRSGETVVHIFHVATEPDATFFGRERRASASTRRRAPRRRDRAREARAEQLHRHRPSGAARDEGVTELVIVGHDEQHVHRLHDPGRARARLRRHGRLRRVHRARSHLRRDRRSGRQRARRRSWPRSTAASRRSCRAANCTSVSACERGGSRPSRWLNRRARRELPRETSRLREESAHGVGLPPLTVSVSPTRSSTPATRGTRRPERARPAARCGRWACPGRARAAPR